jgi:hypothetical protein
MYKICLNKINFKRLDKNIFKSFARKFPKKNDNFAYKIERFKPNDSKYSMSKISEEIVIEGIDPDLNKNVEDNSYEKPTIPEYLKRERRSASTNDYSKIKDNVSDKGLTSGKKMTLPHPKTQYKLTMDERRKLRQQRDEEQAKTELKQLQNNDTTVNRNDLKYIEYQKQLFSRQLSLVKKETNKERRRLFNTENLIDFQTPERLSKRMARLGIASRRQADKLIELGMVKVDGKTVEQNVPVDDNSQIQIYSQHGYNTPIPEDTRLWLFHKPEGFVSAYKDAHNRPTIYQYLSQLGFNLKHYIIVVNIL